MLIAVWWAAQVGLVEPAGAQNGGSITLLGQYETGHVFDCWGWVEPSTYKEYALVGTSDNG